MRPDLLVAPPRKNRIQQITVSTTGAATALIAGVLGLGWVRVKAVTANVQLYFSTSGSDSVLLNAASGDTCGWPLLAGQTEDYFLTNETHLVWDADGAGSLYVVRAGQERTNFR